MGVATEPAQAPATTPPKSRARRRHSPRRHRDRRGRTDDGAGGAGQSRAAAARAQRLAGTPGAMSADAVESAARQAATDSAALALARAAPRDRHRRRACPAVAKHGPVLQRAGQRQGQAAARDVSLGRAEGDAGQHCVRRVSMRLSPGARIPPGLERASGVELHRPMPALPGRSFFALLKDGDAGEGERLLVWAPGTGPRSGAWWSRQRPW